MLISITNDISTHKYFNNEIFRATSFLILLGTNKLDGNETSIVRLSTDSYVLHPDYNPNTLENDIGLIRFRNSVTFTSGFIDIFEI